MRDTRAETFPSRLPDAIVVHLRDITEIGTE